MSSERLGRTSEPDEGEDGPVESEAPDGAAGPPPASRPSTPRSGAPRAGATRSADGSPGAGEAEAAGESGAGRATCDLCGAPMIDRHCKLVCRNCGYQRDCSDP